MLIRNIIIMIIAFCLLSCLITHAQRGGPRFYNPLTLELEVTRTPVNYSFPADSSRISLNVLNAIRSIERVTIIFVRNKRGTNLGMQLITEIDTLILESISDAHTHFIDTSTNQEYYVIRSFQDGEIFFSFSPVAYKFRNGKYEYERPFLYSIIVRTKQI